MSNGQIAPKFDLGVVSISALALERLSRDWIIDPALQSHIRGYWGNLLNEAQWKANDRALRRGGLLRSLFCVQEGNRFVIITDQDQKRTLVQLEEEIVAS